MRSSYDSEEAIVEELLPERWLYAAGPLCRGDREPRILIMRWGLAAVRPTEAGGLEAAMCVLAGSGTC